MAIDIDVEYCFKLQGIYIKAYIKSSDKYKSKDALYYVQPNISLGLGYNRVAAVVAQRFVLPLMGPFAQRCGDLMFGQR